MSEFQQKESLMQQVTIIFYDELTLELKSELKTLKQNQGGRVIIPQDFKQGKSIVAVCEGEVNILNKQGDRLEPATKVAKLG
ncbi:TIGR02922 family protein [Thalassotalea aquiviva]|uniref:TIGR02922 family protein n=1 Tax=Thalassotalea aquiviva TaxID=3242415 RepID=UPI00352BC086